MSQLNLPTVETDRQDRDQEIKSEAQTADAAKVLTSRDLRTRLVPDNLWSEAAGPHRYK